MFFFVFWFMYGIGLAQDLRPVLVVDASDKPVSGVLITTVPEGFTVYSNANGYAEATLGKESRSIWFEKTGYEPQFIPLNPADTHTIRIRFSKEVVLDTFNVVGKNTKRSIDLNGIELNPKTIRNIPSPFGDFNSVLATLGSTVMPSEFSGQYAVRGGNFDENLIYVNGIEVYRPFLARTSQQDGLSFVNPDMVEQASFSAGGWESRYGDKLSSVLAVQYREPKKFKATATASLLQASVHAESATRNRALRASGGLRYKSGTYLINTLPVKGQYKPRFFDGQFLVQWQPLRKASDLSMKSDRLKISWFSSIAHNYFLLTPEKQKTTFGTLGEALKLEVDFDGQEVMEYTTAQNTLQIGHKKGPWRFDYQVSHLRSHEREYFDVLSRYSLCEVETNQNAGDFNDCLLLTGAGKSFRHARNDLYLNTTQATHRGEVVMNEQSKMLWGFTTALEKFDDTFSEFQFEDSSGYLYNVESRQSLTTLSAWRHQGYVEWEYTPDSLKKLQTGARLHYWAPNEQLLVSPRASYQWRTASRPNLLYRIGTGLYQQAPFFRELRRPDGVLNRALKAQSSVHLVSSLEYSFTAWERPFKFTTGLFGKYLWNVVPYDMDNLRLRYTAENSAVAYVYGADFRVSGEFVRGDESWFSLGILRTRENVNNDSLEWIRRPTDQLVTAGIFFQDHLPSNPSLKVYINIVYGSGLAFGPYGYPQLRQSFDGAAYRRVDLGFTKLVSFADKTVNKKSLIDKCWIRVEILNLLQSINTFSYTWIRDYNSAVYAVPNSLSSRFINVKLVVEM